MDDEIHEFLHRQLHGLQPPPPPSPPPILGPPDNDDPLAGLDYCNKCGNNIQDELRPIGISMARGLRAQLKAAPDLSVIHAAKIWKPVTIEGSQLAWWNFIYRDPEGRRGHWGMYPKGAAWVRGEISVPLYAQLVWDRTLGKRRFIGLLEDDSEKGRKRVYFRDVLPFDLDDLGRGPHGSL
jgi:hypothetical protein